jgi:hypothetical protein
MRRRHIAPGPCRPKADAAFMLVPHTRQRIHLYRLLYRGLPAQTAVVHNQ